jgi:hypothetical protein
MTGWKRADLPRNVPTPGVAADVRDNTCCRSTVLILASARPSLENASRSSIRLPILLADSRIVCRYRRLVSSSEEEACFCNSSE